MFDERLHTNRSAAGFVRTRLLACMSLASLVLAACLDSSEPVSKAGPAESVDSEDAANGDEVNGDTERLLRHAVFFKFKEESTPEQIEAVVDAFRELPNKIDTIIDFQWGVNNSPEGLDDGYTHCFLLTFEDEAGRAIYLPHDDHRAFGAVLGPHLDKVFVIDYWGRAGERLGQELQHAVFFKFKPAAAEADVRAVEMGFAALPGKIRTIKGFEWGLNNSPEKHDDGFTHCFMVTFDSEEGRAEYLPHAEHLAFVEVLKPVLEKVRVLDFWANKD